MFIKKLLSIVFGVLFAFFLCEIVLRIYNPFQSRVRGNEIILKSNYSKKIVIDPPILGLENKVKYSTNALGFRGEAPPKDWSSRITLITVGGSTTECSLLSDDSTWTAKLYQKLKKDIPSVWVNNAGLDGCSTYGHQILMRDYVVKLKPNYVVFLIGINDLSKSSFKQEDGFLINRQESLIRKLIKKSELLTTISNVKEALISQKADLDHGKSPNDYKNNESNSLDSIQKINVLNQLNSNKLTYIDRVIQLKEVCQKNNITPIFVTQPMYDDEQSFTWKMMEVYNTALLDYCHMNKLICIDLGKEMPKTIQYYYDHIHYTNTGSSAIAEILYQKLKNIIK